MHACGVIISDNDNVNEYVPLSWDDKNLCWKSQCVPAEAEDQGLLKMDYLGLKNLNMITEIIRLVKETRGIQLDPSTIPVESEVIKNICKDGSTNNIFQLESSGMKDICKKMKPSTFEDLILLVAAYRPGPMDSIPEIIAVKTGVKKPEYLIPELEHILNVTYTKPIYQEQVQQIFRDLAGYSYGQADNVRRAMAKKKEKVLLAERDAFVYGDKERNIKGCKENGIDPEKANQLFDEMISFASYAFNKSHAAVYARIAYLMMYLKYYYFEEFMTIALKWASDKQIMAFIDECRTKGVKVLPPDINKSSEDFALVDGSILYGLSSIKGIVSVDKIIKAREEKPFTDFKDFIKRGHFKKNVTEALIWAGAFDEISSSRKACSLMMEQLVEANDKITEKQEKIEATRSIIDVLNKMSESPKEEVIAELRKLGYTGKTVPKTERKLKELDKQLAELETLNKILDVIEEPVMFKDDKEANLKKEKELLGVYVSGHPVDNYERPKKSVKIEDLNANTKVKIFGVISNLRIKQRKKDGKELAFFNIEDETGSVETNCFCNEYAQFSNLLEEGAVVEAFCEIRSESVSFGTNEEGDEEEETILKATIKDLKEGTKKAKTVMLALEYLVDWEDTLRNVLPYVESKGSNLYLWDKSLNEVRKTDLKVNERILSDANLTCVQI